jgi:lipopolysaccharide export system protein LptC
MSNDYQSKSLKTYSHFVRFSKVSLSLIVIVILVFMVAVPLIAKRGSEMRLAFTSDKKSKEVSKKKPAMLNPTFQGLDDKNQPYKIKANRALQQEDNVIALEVITADLSASDKKWLVMQAKTGLYDLSKGELLLNGDVQLYHEAGHSVFTENALIDTKKMQASGGTPVQILSDFGRLRADSFKIINRGNNLLFSGNVHMILHR